MMSVHTSPPALGWRWFFWGSPDRDRNVSPCDSVTGTRGGSRSLPGMSSTYQTEDSWVFVVSTIRRRSVFRFSVRIFTSGLLFGRTHSRGYTIGISRRRESGIRVHQIDQNAYSQWRGRMVYISSLSAIRGDVIRRCPSIPHLTSCGSPA